MDKRRRIEVRFRRSLVIQKSILETRHMSKHFFVLAMSIFYLAALAIAADSPQTYPDRMRYDSKCFIIDGKDTFLYSGALHYFRCPKPLWADRLQRMRDAGMNCVETYIAWDWHEEQPPKDVNDYSKVDMTDLHDFLDTAINQFGFYVILRPGPYICAEWDGGGYPQWLLNFKLTGYKGNWFRSDEPAYLDWCKHWYTSVAKTVVPFQITHRAGPGGVILWQIENEYNYSQQPTEVKLHQLQALAHDSRDLGIDVPLITCMTSDPLYRTDPYLVKNVIECRNSYPGYRPSAEAHDITLLEKYQPEKPRMITELQGGWFSNAGDKVGGREHFTAAQIRHVTLVAWAHGFTGSNYYMMYGGTNFGDWGAASKTASYDYSAPIREWGGEGPRYFAVKAMGQFLKEHAGKLVRSEPIAISIDEPAGISVFLRKAVDGSLYLFVINDQENDPANGTLTVSSAEASPIKLTLDYELAPYDAKIFYLPAGETDASKGEWLPKPVAPPERPTNLPGGVEITEVMKKVDPGPSEDSWRDLPDGASVEDVGILDRRYVYYRTGPVTAPADKTGAFSVQLPGQDSFSAELNGTRLQPERLGSKLIAELPAGLSGNLFVLYENGGRDNGGVAARCGLLEPTIAYGGISPKYLPKWKMTVLEADTVVDPAALVDDSNWDEVGTDGWANQVHRGEIGVFRAHVAFTASDLKSGDWMLTTGQPSGRRQIFVNGAEVPSGRGETPVVTSHLHEGDNTIVMTVRARRDDAGISGDFELDPKITPDPLPMHWQISGQSAGVEGKWWDPSVDDSAWDRVAISAAGDQRESAEPSTHLVWYRMNFALPAADPHVWVPWKLHIEEAGNGFLYLNGHPLGRIWEIGPQSDFYLPECWLNFGPGSKNVVTLCLRPVSGAATVRKAAVEPYVDYAEAR
jgi:hypothetical protein